MTVLTYIDNTHTFSIKIEYTYANSWNFRFTKH